MFLFGFLFLQLLISNSNFIKGFQYTNDALLDQVIDLPGLHWKTNFNHFSGYLNLKGTQKFIHYWLVESEDIAPENAPLVFWTNGGPGCSGLIGFMTEQGPFRPDSDGNLQQNPYAWNKIANMVFLEQPVGVGFSYSDNKDDYKIGDDQAAADNLATILAFYNKFPHFNHTSLYITSESYGGHYMPTWADAIIKYNDAQEYSQEKINFKGFAVGNPYTDYYSGVGAQMETYWGKQLLPKPLWDNYIANGCTDPVQQLNSSVCSFLLLDFMKKIGNLNPYALDYPVCLTSQQRKMHHFLFENEFMEYEPCEDNFAADYLNKIEVKDSLHVKVDTEWEECSRTTKYNLADKMIPMEHYYKTILNSKTHPDLKVLVYSGDDDGVCGTIGTQKWIYDLGFSVSTLWDTWINNDGQVAGYLTKFNTPFSKDSRFSFLTVHFAGHEVPTYKPKEALELFQMYLDNKI
jgi:carboxypeptidase C (cathepsin A)